MGLGRVAVVGAGTMGAGIAQKFAMEGAEVQLLDLSEEAVSRGLASIRSTLEQGVERRVLRPNQLEETMSRLTGTTDMRDLIGCDLIIEAVFEDLQVKRDVFSKLDAICGQETLLATNTSSFRVSELQSGLGRPERLLGLHFFYHPAKNRLVEVIAGDLTSRVQFARAWRLMGLVGRTPIRSEDAAGFVVNRYFVPWVNEAVRLLDEGVGTPASIDQAARAAFGVGLGPFALMNATGVPISRHAATTLGEALGPFYAPAPGLIAQTDAGGDWEIGEEPSEADPALQEVVRARLAGATWLAAGQLADEGVGSFVEVDLGARVGLRWQLGPFEQANRHGVANAARDIASLAERWGLEIPTCFAERVEDSSGGRPFALPTVETSVEDGVAILTLNRPDQMNALSNRLLSDLESAWGRVEADPDVRAVILHGAGKAFMAGADLKFFAQALDAGDIGRVRTFTERAADLYHRIDASPKRVVVLLDGLSLGGGSELALCADVIVATDRGSLGFPETGLGIYPGLGGTQRTTRRAGRPVARWLVLGGRPIDAKTAHALGLVDVLVDRADGLRCAKELAVAPDLSPLVVPREEGQHPIAKNAERLLSDESMGAWFDGSAMSSEDPDFAAFGKLLSRKAPLAVAEAARLIELADQGVDVASGLAAELSSLENVFSTKDAKEGIRAVLERRRPSFSGH